jgi:hypothetical protein
MASPQRLLLHAPLNGLGDAVRRNEGKAADRYHRRLGMIAPHFDTNPAVSDTLEQLFSASGRWLATKTAERLGLQKFLNQPRHSFPFIHCSSCAQ